MWYQEIFTEITVTLIAPIIVWVLSKLRRKKPGIILKIFVIINILTMTFFLIELPDKLEQFDMFTFRAIIVFALMVFVSYKVAFKIEGGIKISLPKWNRPRIKRSKKNPRIYRSRKNRRKILGWFNITVFKEDGDVLEIKVDTEEDE